MAYSLETSSVKTIVPGAEVSGFCDVVARQKISELSGEVPQLSAGEGIAITTADGKTVITNNISAGTNISVVYDMETNTYRIDGQAGVDPASAVFSESARMPTLGLSYFSGVKISGGDETLYHKTIASFNTYISAISLNGPYVTYLTGDSDVPTDLHPVTSEHWNNIITATKEVSDNGWNWNKTFNTVLTNSASWGQGGGDVVSPYGTLITNGNSAEASISGLIPAHISTADTVSSDASLYATTAVTWTNTINLNSANTVFFSAYESQWVSGNVVLTVYENDEQVTSFNGTAFNFSTAYSEPTNVKLTYMGNNIPLTATISSNYAYIIPDEIVNLYEPSPATQSAIDSKSQIGVIMGSYSTAYTDIYNPAKDAKLIISGERSYAERGRRVTVEFDKNGSTSSLEAGYLVPRGGNGIHGQVLSNYYDRPQWISIASITSGAGSAQINYLSGAIDYVSSNAGLYTGVDPIQVNNTDHEISITGESLSAGPGIDMFSSGGYVVISANGGGGGGAIYTGISPIDVNNTTHQISAKGVSFGVQSPLFFVQDDNEAVIIGCSAGGGTTYTGDAQGALDEVYANSGVWLTAHQSLADYQTTAAMTGYQTKLSSVNNIVYTASLPATPDANTLYLIPEA